MATLVKFFKEPAGRGNSVLAYFPQLNYNKHLYGNAKKTCYAHLGQHSGCTVEYAKTLQPVDKYDDCIDLFEELSKLGYELKIVNKFK